MALLQTTDPLTIFFLVLVFLIILAFVISLHEAAHAYFANLLGDPTARLLGRVTLNPTAHIDPIGTILVPLLLITLPLLAHSRPGFIFGWAKPTPVNPLNFANPRRDSALVASAGPASNFSMAIAASILFRLLPVSIIQDVLLLFIWLNLLLGVFNLLPIPPLDGFKVLIGVLPKEAALRLSILESYGPVVLILFLFVFFRFLSPVLISLINTLLNLLVGATF